ncbi:glycosyl transferase family 1 [Lysinibacillus sp. 2017]|nr:glycosyl transferase family 1 [Lysinibacillus sp. 2017]TGN37306.1 glycosyltransferase [Lysinibacillus sp. S2017]
MKILWLVNIPLPEVCRLMDEKSTPFGGWLINASKYLAAQDNITLSIAFPKLKSKNVMEFRGEKIDYFAFPHLDINDNKLIKDNGYLKLILKKAQPDIVHIFGTEFAHSLAMVNACNELGIKTVINIQGLVSVIEKHYLANLPTNVQKRFTFRDFVKQDNILQQKKEFKKRGLMEIEAIRKTEHVIGRTTWDLACASQINPNVNYHFCNETLREEFYKNEWLLKKCEKYTIFLSQASYPVKGLHYVLEALPMVLKKFPKTKLYIAGYDITGNETVKEKLKFSSYAKYIKEMIRNLNISNCVVFTGVLDEKQMCERYLKSNLFVCPSTIENSPNSLGEAMLLGAPCIASNVGGVSDMLKHKEEGYVYQADAPYMLAHYICELFENEELTLKFSKNGRKRAFQTHDSTKNTKRIMEIYENISQSKVKI